MGMKFRVPKVFKSVKFMLALLNGIFLSMGVMLLIAGLVVLKQYFEMEVFLSRRFFNMPSFVIATGAIICLATVLGFYAAFTEKFYAIVGYTICLLVVMFFEVSIIVVGFGLYNDASTAVRPAMSSTLQYYQTRMDVTIAWDNLQSEYECCGVVGRGDWGTARIPISCCYIERGTVGTFECTIANAYTLGCAAALGDYLGVKAYAVAIVGVVALCVQLLILPVSGWLAWRTKYDEVELES